MIKKLLIKTKSIILNIKALTSLIYSTDFKRLYDTFKIYKDKHYKLVTDPNYLNIKQFRKKLIKFADSKEDNEILLEAIEDKEYVQTVHHTLKGDLFVKIDKGDINYKNLPAVATTQVPSVLQDKAISEYGLMIKELGPTFVEKLHKDYNYIMGSADYIPKLDKPDLDLTKEISFDLNKIHSKEENKTPTEKVFDECFDIVFPVVI